MNIFERIIAREVPAQIVYEDADVVAFRDADPKAPAHALIVPRRRIARVGEATEADAAVLGRLLLASRAVAERLGVLDSGYRLVINHGRDAGESVPHLHVHLLGGRHLAWPPG